MKQLSQLNPESLSPEVIANLKLRQAARAVVFDDDRNVALLHVSKKGYYKLPGGGVESDEDLHSALKRECLEEIGSSIEVTRDLGMIVGYRGKFGVRQESYCYTARLIGKKGNPNFTEREMEDGFRVLWIPLDEAIRLVGGAKTKDYQGNFIQSRDLIFLQEAKKVLS